MFDNVIKRSPELKSALMSLCGSSTSRRASPVSCRLTWVEAAPMVRPLTGLPSPTSTRMPSSTSSKTLWLATAVLRSLSTAWPLRRSTTWRPTNWAPLRPFVVTNPSTRSSRPRISTAARPTPSTTAPIPPVTPALSELPPASSSWR